MNKPYFRRNIFLIDWRHKRLKNTKDLLLFYEEYFCGFSESEDKNGLGNYQFYGCYGKSQMRHIT